MCHGGARAGVVVCMYSCRWRWTNEVSEADELVACKALRGSADSFGIITHFHLQTVAAPDRVVLFSLDIAGIGEDVDEATQAFLHVQKVVRDGSIIDRRLSFGFFIQNGNWTVWGIYLGDEDHFENLVRMILCLKHLKRVYPGMLSHLPDTIVRSEIQRGEGSQS